MNELKKELDEVTTKFNDRKTELIVKDDKKSEDELTKLTLKFYKEREEILSMYKSNVGSDTFGCLIAGDAGVGKTTMIGTAPEPILVYMFDPKGYMVLREKFLEGRVLIVPLWKDQSQSPTEWKKFRELSNHHIRSGFIESTFATVAVDSLTWCLEAATNYVADMAPDLGIEKSRTERVRNIPFMGDYRIIYQEILDKIKLFSSLPINLIFTAHMETMVNKEGTIVGRDLSVFKKLKDLIPPMFTEKYVLTTTPSGGGYAKRELLTQPKGSYRIGSTQFGNKLDPKEEPNIKHLMEKVGLTSNDKTLLPNPDLSVVKTLDEIDEVN